MKVQAAVALWLVLAFAAGCGPGAGDQVRPGSRTVDQRTDHTKTNDARSTGGGSSSTADRGRSHVGNGKK